MYVNNMLQAVKSTFLLYADDSCLIYQHEDIAKIEKMQQAQVTYLGCALDKSMSGNLWH